jgi:hypothetical protein
MLLTAATILAEVLMGAVAVLGWLFVILYSRVRWYATPEGRHLMKFTTGLALTFSLSLLFQFTDPGRWTRVVLSITLFGWLAFELANRTRLHLRAQREARSSQ